MISHFQRRSPTLLLAAVLLGLGVRARSESPVPASTVTLPALSLNATAEVDRKGIFLSQLVSSSDGRALPAIRLLPAPELGTPLLLSRARLRELLARPELGLSFSNWTGADRVLVSRRMRKLEESELLGMLAKALQSQSVRDRGELELRLGRPWSAVPVPDDPLTVRLLEVPPNGLTAFNLLRFELLAGNESVGSWQTVVHAKVWREIWVARSALRRGQSVALSDLARERRDVLALREALADPLETDLSLQASDPLPAGAVLLQRHLRLQPVVHRGQMVNVTVEDGFLHLVLKVEVLEDGAPGQIVRLRNPTSRREFRGKVQNEKNIVAIL